MDDLPSLSDKQEPTKKRPWRFIPHPQAERFDAVSIRTVERWKESELSGDEWRFSHVVEFIRNGQVVAQSGGLTIKEACLVAAYQFNQIKTDGTTRFMDDLSEVCCQPSCPEPWTVLLHPVTRYSKGGEEMARPYSAEEVRGFCERHKERGDCALDDTDSNYVLVETRFPPTWNDIEVSDG